MSCFTFPIPSPPSLPLHHPFTCFSASSHWYSEDFWDVNRRPVKGMAEFICKSFLAWKIKVFQRRRNTRLWPLDRSLPPSLLLSFYLSLLQYLPPSPSPSLNVFFSLPSSHFFLHCLQLFVCPSFYRFFIPYLYISSIHLFHLYLSFYSTFMQLIYFLSIILFFTHLPSHLFLSPSTTFHLISPSLSPLSFPTNK